MKKLALIVAVAGALAAVSLAQMMMMGGGSTPYQYLNRKDVKDDIKLTDDQNTKILAAQQEMGDARRQALQDAQANGAGIAGLTQEAIAAMQKTMKPLVDKYNDTVKSTLTSTQQTRLLQIFMQIQGDSSLTNPDVQKLVGLTPDQVTHISDLQKKMNEANMALFKKVQSQEIDFQTARDDFTKNGDALKVELGKTLNGPEKTKFKDAQGAKFTLDPSEPLNPFGGRPGGGRSGGGN